MGGEGVGAQGLEDRCGSETDGASLCASWMEGRGLGSPVGEESGIGTGLVGARVEGVEDTEHLGQMVPSGLHSNPSW